MASDTGSVLTNAFSFSFGVQSAFFIFFVTFRLLLSSVSFVCVQFGQFCRDAVFFPF
jgi:hypothetical protein